MTIAVDFPDDASPGKTSGCSHSDEFMAKDTSKPHVTLGKLQVSFANTGGDHIDKDLSCVRNRGWMLGLKSNAILVKTDCSQFSVPQGVNEV